MELSSADFLGRVTFITGPGKACGKTSLLVRALGLLREAGERPAFLGTGFDGAPALQDRAAPQGGAGSSPRIACRSGEVFVSAERFLRQADCESEILEALPGSTALGRLAVARARRDGHVVLVGSERNELAAHAISLIRGELWARTVLVDGALNRITQVSAFAGARFVYAARVGPGDLGRHAKAMRRLWTLTGLPLAGPLLPQPVHQVDGPLTAESLAAVPETARSLVVDDLTKVFLDGGALRALLRERCLAVRGRVEFGGFVVVLRDLGRSDFEKALGDEEAASHIVYNPYEAVHA